MLQGGTVVLSLQSIDNSVQEKMISDLRAEAESLSMKVREEEERTREAEKKMEEKENQVR